MTHLGTILTSAPDEPWLRERAASFPVLKVVTAWGLPWNDDLRRVVATLCPVLVVRTVAGDPSYVDEAGRPRFLMPDTNDCARELDPWYAAFRAVADPGDRLWFEIGNEPLIGKPNMPATISARDVWAYADILAQTLSKLAGRYPLASFILPAQMLNHRVSVEGVPYAQPWMVGLIADALRTHGVLDALRGRLAVGLHAYTEAQYTEGRALAAAHFPSLPVWLTEFALNREMPAAERGRRYAELLSGWDVEAALLYHLDAFGGTDPTHFNANYRLTLDTLRAVRVPPPLKPTPPPEPAPMAVHHTARIDNFDMDIWQWRSVASFRNHLAQYKAKQTAPWAKGVTYHHSESPIPATWRGIPSMLGMAEFYRVICKCKGGPEIYTVSGAPNPEHDGIWQLTPLNLQGVHAGDCNTTHWAIEVVGSYQTQRWDAGTSALALGVGRALLDWIGAGVSTATVKGHRDCLANKDCPGKAIDMASVRKGLEAL